MNQLTNFNHKMFGELPVIIVNDIEWFGASESAKALSFSNPRAAIINHVDTEDVTVHDIPTNSGIQNKKFINESGLYSLIFGAAKQGNNKEIKENAKKFKRWVTSEVLPSIRKTGSYNKVVPLNSKESLIAAMKLSIETSEELDQVKGEVKEIRHMVEEQITLTSGEQRRLQKGIAMKVYEIENDPEYRPTLFREIHREIKDRFGVASYKDIKRKELQAALNYIEHWVPRKVS
ncbi:BRO family protein [Cytobacillus kochii]|uniref:BRO family protein n=1 Tax=Cytobacillus kochii TaxID=859143 RepID=UPI00203B8FB2|nr:ORF6C domain-containing protein [Cytobacillus kochii]MCM3324272.1 ORF6C domain-containing protein [Cytobacillus kochii]MCM3346660.1 ORF6C domain-containing protein [Cytobacillus kochii]